MAEGCGGSPILFEGVDANGSSGRINIGVVYFGEEVAAGWSGGEVGGEAEFELEVACVVRCLFGSFDFRLQEKANSFCQAMMYWQTGIFDKRNGIKDELLWDWINNREIEFCLMQQS